MGLISLGHCERIFFLKKFSKSNRRNLVATQKASKLLN